MIRVNLLKAVGGDKGRLESLILTGGGSAFITRREVLLGLLCLGVAGAALVYQLWTPDASPPPDETPVIAEASPIIEIDEPPEPRPRDNSEPSASNGSLAEKPPTNEPAADDDQVSPEKDGSPAEPQTGAEQRPATPTPDGEKRADKEPKASKQASAPATRLSQLVVSTQGDSLRVFAATGTQPEFRTFQLPNPKRLVVDLPGVRLALPRAQHEQIPEHPLVKRIRAGQYRADPPQARIVLDVTSYPEIEILPQFNGLYLVIKEL